MSNRNTPTYTKATVTTSSSKVLDIASTRSKLLLQNDSDTVIYLRFGAAAVLNEGIRLNANGGSYLMTLNDGVPAAAVYAIHGGTGNKVLTIEETLS